MLSSYPTKHARVGNAVGLDTPASAVVLLRALREARYDLGDGFPEDGDALIHPLIAAGGHDPEWLTEEQLPRRRCVPPPTTAAGSRNVPALRHVDPRHWGAPPGGLYTVEDSGEIVLAACSSATWSLMVQPPRGFART